MKILEKQFTLDGFTYTQVWREGMFAIYKQEKGIGASYEAIHIGSHNGFQMTPTLFIPPAEVYPKAKAWGDKAFTTDTIEKAHKRIIELKQKAEISADLKAENTREINDGREIELPEDLQIVPKSNKGVVSLNKLPGFNWPDGEFSMKELKAAFNMEQTGIYPTLKVALEKGEIIEVRRESQGRGRPAVIYKKSA